MEKELISVLIPLMNDDDNDLLLLCLQTILEQDYPNLEIIISSKLEKINLGNFFNDSRIRVISIPENSLAMIRMELLRQAKGEFVTFLSPSGGITEYDALTTAYRLVRENDLDVVISNIVSLTNGVFLYEESQKCYS